MRLSPKAVIAMLSIWALGFSMSFSQSNQEPQKAGQAQAELVLIPGGDFLMGKGEQGDCSPVHKVFVDSFYMDKYEVTNSQYAQFCEETGRHFPEFWGMEEFNSGEDFPNHPVIGISWIDARDYAEWAGKRLPTEAEWEYAARGGLVGMKFPNGEELDSSLANYTLADLGGTIVVGSFAPNGYGLHDMAGNVWEWVADYYDGDYYAASPVTNPGGPEDGKFKVIRGGGWHSGPSCNTVYFRNALRSNWVDFAVGFRCAKNVGQ
ncbi:MAG: formylglycine-generating enzyme family protein [Candidatus Zixiibacteriota bacterium]